jgi:hypothetical protein
LGANNAFPEPFELSKKDSRDLQSGHESHFNESSAKDMTLSPKRWAEEDVQAFIDCLKDCNQKAEKEHIILTDVARMFRDPQTSQRDYFNIE